MALRLRLVVRHRFVEGLRSAHTDYSIHVTIEEPAIYPTAQQAINCLIVCQMLSNCYRDIQLFRFDDKTGEVFILAGDELQIIVPPNEAWKFLDETEF